jgi:hypothetical protein
MGMKKLALEKRSISKPTAIYEKPLTPTVPVIAIQLTDPPDGRCSIG